MWVSGRALDGTPLLTYRNATYDRTLASVEEFVLGATLLMDSALASSPTGKVTVLVHTAAAPGCINGAADTAVIKAFISSMSDNFPETLQRLIVYPFPWMAQAVWSVVRVFIDPTVS